MSQAKQTQLQEKLIYYQSRTVRIKPNPKNTSSIPPLPPSFFPGSTSLLIFYLLPLRSAGGRGMGVAFSSSHIVSATPSSSHSSPAPVWGPSHERLSSTNCSSMGPPRGHKSCQQTCSSVGSSLHRSCQEPAPAWAPDGVTVSFGHPPALAWGPPWATGGDLLHRGPPWAAWAQPTSPWLSPQAAGESLLQRLGHFLPLLLHWPWCLQSCFSHIVSPLSPAAVVEGFPPPTPFFTALPQRCYDHGWWARPRPVAGPSWRQLALALSDTGEASGSSSQKLLL